MNRGRQRGSKLFSVAARRQARERRVDEPQLVADPRHLVNLHVAGGVAAARQEAGVVLRIPDPLP